MQIIETNIFTKCITNLISDDEYAEFQNMLIANPLRGDLIVWSGGCRKIRYRLANKGKSSGIRVIYYYISEDGIIYMLYVYPKNQQDNLSQEQCNKLKALTLLLKEWNYH